MGWKIRSIIFWLFVAMLRLRTCLIRAEQLLSCKTINCIKLVKPCCVFLKREKRWKWKTRNRRVNKNSIYRGIIALRGLKSKFNAGHQIIAMMYIMQNRISALLKHICKYKLFAVQSCSNIFAYHNIKINTKFNESCSIVY